ncbi:MAG: T9SS type A sorting domain-containing protein [Flavobacterium sp.]|nr:MAG: T9SS type A sorting domain-containing protein [Flavobacterium sp.]
MTTQLIELLRSDQYDASSISMFPNPAHGQFAIHFADAQQQTFITMYDVQGKLILSRTVQPQSDAIIDISKVQPGLYFVKAVSDGKSVVKKLVVK